MILDRFEKKFDKTDGCWIWNAATDGKGYGAFSYKGKRATASRVSYELYKGSFPSQMHVLHTCDNPRCVNPDHLFLGTNKDNVEDRKSKGRRAGRLKILDQNAIDSLRKILSTNNYSYREINRRTGISRETIRRVATNTY